MRVYLLYPKIDSRENFVWKPMGLSLNEEVSRQIRTSLKGAERSIVATWQPARLSPAIVQKQDAALPIPDLAIVSVYQGLIFSHKAIGCLQDLLESHGELLPLICDEGDYQFFHVTKVINALDIENSLVRYSTNLPLPIGGRTSLGGIKQIEGNYSYAFLEDCIKDTHIFRLPLYYGNTGSNYVSETFKARVESCGLNSLEFLLVWDSEDPDYFDERYRNEPERWERYKQELAEQRRLR
jgi:hypothetical protein